MTPVCPETGGPHNLSCDDKPTRCVDCGAKQEPEDIRIRMVSNDGRFRVVAPNARKAHGTVHVNDVLVIEELTKDSLGAPSWKQLGERLTKRTLSLGSDDQLQAIWKLLAGTER